MKMPAAKYCAAFATLILSVTVIACTDATAPTAPIQLRFSGVVTDRATGLPISNSTVEVVFPLVLPFFPSGPVATTLTDIQGRYAVSYEIVPDGCRGFYLQMRVRSDGYAEYETHSNRGDAPQCISAVQVRNFRLERPVKPPTP